MNARALALALVLVCAACSRPAPGPETPSACVRAMSASAREGDTKAYLACFSGELRESLEEARQAAGEEAFAGQLRARMAPVRGMALSEEATGNNRVTLRVEWVLDDRNEVQIFTLLQESGVWRIVSMESAQYNKPEIPYGTEVY